MKTEVAKNEDCEEHVYEGRKSRDAPRGCGAEESGEEIGARDEGDGERVGRAYLCGGEPVCVLHGKKHVTFGFPFATSLPDPERLLEGSGKNMRHVKLRSADDLEKKGLRELIVAASRFEGGSPMPGMGGRRRQRRLALNRFRVRHLGCCGGVRVGIF